MRCQCEPLSLIAYLPSRERAGRRIRSTDEISGRRRVMTQPEVRQPPELQYRPSRISDKFASKLRARARGQQYSEYVTLATAEGLKWRQQKRGYGADVLSAIAWPRHLTSAPFPRQLYRSSQSNGRYLHHFDVYQDNIDTAWFTCVDVRICIRDVADDRYIVSSWAALPDSSCY